MIKQTWARGRKVLYLGLSLCLTATTLSGCWDDRELDDLGIVSGTAYDWEDEEWRITYQIINPSSTSSMGGTNGGSAISPPFLTFTERGSTLTEAVARSNLRSTRQLFFSHSRISIINLKTVDQGLPALLDLFLRKPNGNETLFVFLSERQASDVLEQLMQVTKNPGMGIQLMIQQESRLSSYYPGTRMFELTVALSSDSHCATVPEIKLTKPEVMDKVEETQVTDLPSRISLGRLGVLKKDRFVGWLNTEEAFGLTFLRNRINAASIPFSSDPKKEKKDSTFSLLESKTVVKPVWENDHFVMHVHIKGEGMLLETGGKVNLSKDNELTQLENNIEGEVLEYIQSAWRAVQKLNADATEFASLIHSKYPKRWKQIQADDSWDQVFKEIEIRPSVTIDINRFGLSSKSYKSVEQN
ncbi:Ger(x)C family spore germination protein [Paenibacillus sanguinis]|uniref:Ger(x)C family spore germination protein n=1 Tax=Paenibacillus sanguinis TaxID=225906 RepID=UPI000380A514|nr:Ger(x)C family spore germination protein [Paenibacillus sanguinis]